MIDLTRLITADQRAAMDAQRSIEAGRDEALACLRDTDWMVLRAFECGTPVPPDVRDRRAAARVLLSAR
jgi:hypothetical protein